MEKSQKTEVVNLALTHDLTVETAMGLHKMVTDIAYAIGSSDMKQIYDIVANTLFLNANELIEDVK